MNRSHLEDLSHGQPSSQRVAEGCGTFKQNCTYSTVMTPMRKIGWVAILTSLLIIGGTLAATMLHYRISPAEATLSPDEYGRFNITVFINGEGPFPFLVDTGAAMSCVSPSLAERLKLSRIPGVKLHVQGTSGTQNGTMYLATSYKSDAFDKHLEPLVGLLSVSAVKDGVVGMNAFASRRVELNFADRRLIVTESGTPAPNFSPIPAELKGTDVMVDVVIDGVRARAVVDTGARHTIANTALRDRLGLKADDPRLTPAEPSQGATEQHLPASAASFHKLRFGTAEFDSPRLTFSELDLFVRRGLQNTPAVLLGMDLLGKLKAIAVDYPRSEVQVRP